MKVLMLLDNPFTNDRRVQREAETLVKNGFLVQLVCLKQSALLKEEIINGVEIIRLFDLSIFDPKKFSEHKKLAKYLTDNFEFDIVHAHDQTMLNIGAKIKKLKKTILIYDSHELFHSWPLNSSNYDSKLLHLKSLLVRKWFIFRESKNKKHIDFLITVNNSIAKNLENYLKINSSKISVLRNTPEYSSPAEKSTILRDHFNIPENQKILVFIGANIYLNSLNMEQVFEEFEPRKDIAIVVIAAFNDHSNQIKEYVKANNYTNIYFHDKINHEVINSYLASADVGLVPTWNKKDLSYWYALDNKLFEYLQAGIPILATSQPEYQLIVENLKIGVCVNPDIKNDYLNGFLQILENYDQYKQNATETSKELCWENEQKILTTFYNAIKLQNQEE